MLRPSLSSRDLALMADAGARIVDFIWQGLSIPDAWLIGNRKAFQGEKKQLSTYEQVTKERLLTPFLSPM